MIPESHHDFNDSQPDPTSWPAKKRQRMLARLRRASIHTKFCVSLAIVTCCERCPPLRIPTLSTPNHHPALQMLPKAANAGLGQGFPGEVYAARPPFTRLRRASLKYHIPRMPGHPGSYLDHRWAVGLPRFSAGQVVKMEPRR